MTATRIGTWHERESRELIEYHTSYAADWRKVRTTAGEYPAYLVWKMHDPKPWADWFTTSVPAEVIDGKEYNGIGGYNYSSSPVRLGPITFSIGFYAFVIRDAVAKGHVTLNEGWEWLALRDKDGYYKAMRTYTKEMVRALAEEKA